MNKYRIDIMIELEERITGISKIREAIQDVSLYNNLSTVVNYMDRYHIPYIPKDNLSNKPYEEMTEFIKASTSSIITVNERAHNLAIYELSDVIAALSTGILNNSITDFYVSCIVEETATVFESFVKRAKFDIELYSAMLYKLTEISYSVYQYERLLRTLCGENINDSIDNIYDDYAYTHFDLKEIKDPNNRLKIIKDFRKVTAGLILSGFFNDKIEGDIYIYMRSKLSIRD